MLVESLGSYIAVRVLGAVLTLYMMAILLRWLGPYLEVDLKAPRWAWLPRLTDPLIQFFRRLLPDMGPFDWSPIAALAAVFFLRLVLLRY